MTKRKFESKRWWPAGFSALCFAAGLWAAIPAHAEAAKAHRVQCDSLKTVLEVDDDVCGAIEAAAESCFSRLNQHFYGLKNNPGASRKDRLSRIADLKADYAEALKVMDTLIRHMSTVGEGKACIDESAAVEVWIEEINKDFNDLKRSGY